jgi:putative redox protein
MKFTLTESGAFQSDFEFGELSISGNSAIGYRPYQLFVSSIVGCSGSVFRTVLNKKRISYEDIEIEAFVERDEGRVNKISKVSLHFIVKGKNLNQEQLQKALIVSTKNCPIIQSVKGSIVTEETVEVREVQ